MEPNSSYSNHSWWLHASHVPAMRRVMPLGAILLICLILVWLMPPVMHDVAGYLPLHIFLETVAVVVAMLVFTTGWYAHGRHQSGSTILLASAFFGVAWLDFFHILSYKGMPDFITPSDPEKALAFWLAARALATVALLIVAIRPWRPFKSVHTRYVLFALSSILTALLSWLFLYHLEWLPRTFIPGQGLTPFKINFEYTLIALNCATALLLWMRMHKPLPFNASLLLCTVCIMAMSEFFFTLYASVTDAFNVLGHIYKVIAYLLLYRAIVVENIERPYNQLRSSQNQLKATLDAIPDLLFEVDLTGRYIDYRAMQSGLLTAPASELIGKTVFDVMPRAAAEICISALHEAHEQGHSHGKQIELMVPDGKRWFELSVSRKSVKHGELPVFIVLSRDITERIETDERLHKLSQAVDQSPSNIMITDLNGNIEYANPAFTKATGYSLEEVRGKNPRMLQSGKTPRETYQDLWKHLHRGESWKGEFINRDKKGIEYIEQVLVSPVRQPDGRITHYLAIKDDITEKKRTAERIEKLAHFDMLTELPNRVLLNDRVKHALSFVQRSHQQMAVMFLDLDNFKNINDSLGHSVGDELLIQVAKRLKAAIRDEDTVSRRGGDEFILIFPGANAKTSAKIAEKILHTVASPYAIENQELIITCSIGIAMYPSDGEDFETLAKNADVAMYRVKRERRGTFRFFMPEMHAHSARALQLGNALRYALERNQLYLHYQPQVAIEDGNILGAEVLLRWQHPELGAISPAEFIPIAEDSGQIVAIGEWVLRTAVRQLKTWMDNGLPPMIVAVNLSAIQFKHSNLPEVVSRILEEEKLPPEYLELELTEGVAMDKPDDAIAVMNELHQRGVRMSIDDFGTGYSSLSYLKKFKVYKLKIDQSFVRDITVDNDDKTIVTTIINMARSLGFLTIAEGVETAGQLQFLREQGCNEIQGYYFSRPLSTEQFEAFVRNRPSARLYSITPQGKVPHDSDQ